MAARTKPTTVDAYVAQVEPHLRPLYAEARAFVRTHAPARLDERLYMGMPTWIGAWPALYLADYSRHVNLGFYRGADLADPDGLLEGTGKSLRHVKLRSEADLTPKLAKLVKAAAKLDAEMGK